MTDVLALCDRICSNAMKYIDTSSVVTESIRRIYNTMGNKSSSVNNRKGVNITLPESDGRIDVISTCMGAICPKCRIYLKSDTTLSVHLKRGCNQ